MRGHRLARLGAMAARIRQRLHPQVVAHLRAVVRASGARGRARSAGVRVERRHAEHERRAGGADVRAVPIEAAGAPAPRAGRPGSCSRSASAGTRGGNPGNSGCRRASARCTRRGGSAVRGSSWVPPSPAVQLRTAGVGSQCKVGAAGRVETNAFASSAAGEPAAHGVSMVGDWRNRRSARTQRSARCREAMAATAGIKTC